MQQANQWLTQIMSIVEGRPYNSNLTVESERNDDNSSPNNETMNISGIALFHMQNGQLAFDFFIDSNNRHPAIFEVSKASNVVLSIPPLNFEHPIMFTARPLFLPPLLPLGDKPMRGIVKVEHFGDKDAHLSGINIQLTGLPKGWYGNDQWTYFEGLTHEDVQRKENGTLVIPNGNPSLRVLSGCTLKANGWTAVLREISSDTGTNPNVSHLCTITKENGKLTGATAHIFINENLFPFLDFVFGQKTRFHIIIGYKDGIDSWVITSSPSTVPIKTAQRNWFLTVQGHRIDLAPLFQNFCNTDPDIKKHLRKVIQQYVDSEEIMGTLRCPAVAASISFAALEGLTRSIISTYPCKDEWLKNDLSLRPEKYIKDAIEMVANQQFGKHSTTFKEASDEIYKVRNATFHTDLTSEQDQRNAYYRWNSSQALIEFLLLDKLGLDQIPNRTAHGKYDIMGKDMFAEVRSEELNFQ